MMRIDRDALICDLAETYKIYDMREHPVGLIATLAAGLREDSRIKLRMGGQRLSDKESLLALIFDKVNWICWTKTKDAERKKNIPKSIYAELSGMGKKKESGGFSTPEEYEKRRRELLGE